MYASLGSSGAASPGEAGQGAVEAPKPQKPWLSRLRWAVLGIAAAVACLPGVPPAAALVSGVAVALTLGNPSPEKTRWLARRLLPAAVIGLGGGMDLGAVARAGAHGIGYTIVTIAVCGMVGTLVARALRVERRTGILVTVGTAICGGSAIAAAAPVIAAEDRQISVALATVFLLNSVALLIFPPLGHAAHLGQQAFGLWAALGIHDTSSVVGAAIQYGKTALSIATTVKLARALWIVPVTIALGLFERHRTGGPSKKAGHPPWFIFGFVAAAALATYAPGLRPAGLVLAEAARRAMVFTLFLIGIGLSRQGLKSVGVRPLVMGVLLWIAMGGGTFLAIRFGLPLS